jgi:hypothetical protein
VVLVFVVVVHVRGEPPSNGAEMTPPPYSARSNRYGNQYGFAPIT